MKHQEALSYIFILVLLIPLITTAIMVPYVKFIKPILDQKIKMKKLEIKKNPSNYVKNILNIIKNGSYKENSLVFTIELNNQSLKINYDYSVEKYKIFLEVENKFEEDNVVYLFKDIETKDVTEKLSKYEYDLVIDEVSSQFEKYKEQIQEERMMNLLNSMSI